VLASFDAGTRGAAINSRSLSELADYAARRHATTFQAFDKSIDAVHDKMASDDDSCAAATADMSGDVAMPWEALAREVISFKTRVRR
jgi:hypothetical protein